MMYVSSRLCVFCSCVLYSTPCCKVWYGKRDVGLQNESKALVQENMTDRPTDPMQHQKPKAKQRFFSNPMSDESKLTNSFFFLLFVMINRKDATLKRRSIRKTRVVRVKKRPFSCAKQKRTNVSPSVVNFPPVVCPLLLQQE